MSDKTEDNAVKPELPPLAPAPQPAPAPVVGPTPMPNPAPQPAVPLALPAPTPQVASAAPSVPSNADWNERYKNEGHIWGDKPSLTAKRLADKLRPVSNILEVGFGYGRDIIHLVNRGHRVHGVENAVAGLTEATRQLQDKVNAGSAHLLLGEFARAALGKNEFDALYSHRVLHLLGANGHVHAFVDTASRVLKPGGLLYVSARNQKDFNPNTMHRLADGTVERNDRPGHLISLWDEARFKRVFDKHFEILEFVEGQEIESMKTGDNTEFTLMIAKKRKTPKAEP